MKKIESNPDGLIKEVIILEGPLSCISSNNSVTKLAVGGKNVLKILSCNKQSFEEISNLRNDFSSNSSYLSTNEVNWCKSDEKTLVSASNQGVIVVWDISQQQAVYYYVITENQRAVNSLDFFAFSSDNLLAASQDGSCRVLDLRIREIANTYGPRIESPAREVQFDPRNSHQFAVVFENGFCQLWDLRMNNGFHKSWVAHAGPCVCLNWHPIENWLVTGGRDKIAAVWDFSNQPVPPKKMIQKYSAETVASVGKVKWRPRFKYQVLTTPMLNESYASIWDVRSPYVPSAYFIEKRDTIGGVVWKDDYIFYTCGRDSKLCRFIYSDHTNLKEKLNHVSLSFNIFGSILHSSLDKTSYLKEEPTPDPPRVVEDKKQANNTPRSTTDENDKVLTMTSITYEYKPRFHFPPSSSPTPSSPNQDSQDTLDLENISYIKSYLSMEPFISMAQNYKLGSDCESFYQICQHNSKVASSSKKHNISTAWSMLALMFESNDPNVAKENVVKRLSKADTRLAEFYSGDDAKKLKSSTGSVNESEEEANSPLMKSLGFLDNFPYPTTSEKGLFDIDGTTNNEANFSDNNAEIEHFSIEEDLNLPQESDWSEFFHDPATHTTPLDDSDSGGALSAADFNSVRTLPSSKIKRIEVEEVVKYELLGTVPYLDTITTFDYTLPVKQIIEDFAEQNDVQTAVTMVLVLGSKITPHLDHKKLNIWVSSYIDQLNEFKLYITSTEVHNAFKPTEPQASTSFKISCSSCLKPLSKGWRCEKCSLESSKKVAFNDCAICRLPVKGLYIWCQGCSHGGHSSHLITWFSNHKECPVGCGHMCEYS